MQADDPVRCLCALDSVPSGEPRWQLLKAEAFFRTGQYRAAAEHYALAEAAFPEQTVRGLEACYRELEDYKMAYHYACKLRQLG